MSSVISIGIFILIFLMTLAIPVLIGVFVYRDAKKRNMNAVLWTLIAVLAPTFIGLIIYLIVRADHSPLQCPSCSQTVTERYTVCPKCGAKLKLTCEKCSFPVEPQWHICPNCAEPLPENQKNPLPAAGSDKRLVGILIAVILIPVFLCVSLAVGFSLLKGDSNQSSSSMYTDSLDKTELSKVDEVNSWLADCDQKGDGIYVLAHESKAENTQSYLIYRKGTAKMADIQTNSILDGFFRKPVNVFAYIDLEESDPDGYDLCYLVFFEKSAELKITENGTAAAYSKTDSDTNWPELVSECMDTKAMSGPISIEIQNNTSLPLSSMAMDIYFNGEISETNVCQNANDTAFKKGEKVSFTIYPSSFNDADSLDYDLTISDSDNNIVIKNKFTAFTNTNYQFIIDYDANGKVTLVPVN